MDIASLIAGLESNPALAQAAQQAGVDPSQAQGIVQGALEHLTSGGSAESLAETLAGKIGIDPALVQQFLPQITGLLQAHVAGGDAPEGLGGLLGTLQSSPVAGLLSGDAAGGLAGGALNFAKGLFGGSN